eukprot:TRINITY_DN72978_c0_g1_i1.p1 TRINITY_DN72978_c0_g1~~TRINITY_DN72978_c0_g1_i1.p1  ORF type:complete len:411 (+),score=100.29 TRINITY_DN72978_c0_g1_i1:79-1311(+)
MMLVPGGADSAYLGEEQKREDREGDDSRKPVDILLPAAHAASGSAAAAVAAASEASIVSSDELRAEAFSLCNDGTRLLRKGANEDAVRVLARAQSLLDRASDLLVGATDEEERSLAALKADVAGNLGICHRRLKEMGPAVRQLQLALKQHKARLPSLEHASIADLRMLMAAHLNLASCHLESEAPAAALQHATAATELGGHLLTHSKRPANESTEDPTENDFAMLAVSFHKVAESHQGLKDWGKATFAYAQAHEVVQRSLGAEHPISKVLENTNMPSPRRRSDEQRRFCAVANLAANAGKSTGCPPIRNGGKSPLPIIPPGARASAMKTKARNPFAFELRGYELGQDRFQSWPPKKTTLEEKEWYSMARSQRLEAPALPESAAMQEPVADAFSLRPGSSRKPPLSLLLRD